VWQTGNSLGLADSKRAEAVGRSPPEQRPPYPAQYRPRARLSRSEETLGNREVGAEAVVTQVETVVEAAEAVEAAAAAVEVEPAVVGNFGMGWKFGRGNPSKIGGWQHQGELASASA